MSELDQSTDWTALPYETKINLVKTYMMLCGIQGGREMWDVCEVPGPFDISQVAAVVFEDDPESDADWHKQFGRLLTVN